MLEDISKELYSILEKSVNACSSNLIALSGGLDSSIIANFLKSRNPMGIAIIAEDFVSTDLTYCQMMSKESKIPLSIYNVKTSEILEAIEKTIKILKNFNDIEIRNSVVMYLVIKYVKDQGKRSLITGDGADELFAGYNFFLNKSTQEIEQEQKRIWKIMHFPSHEIGKHLGVKIESPYLSDDIIDFAKSIPVEFKVQKTENITYGKWILRKIFEDKIPTKIVWRQKSAMQDGSGTSGLTELFNSVISDKVFEVKREEISKMDNVVLRTKESLHYYEVFKKFFSIKKESSPENSCPFCKSFIENNSKFCRMCGAYPI